MVKLAMLLLMMAMTLSIGENCTRALFSIKNLNFGPFLVMSMHTSIFRGSSHDIQKEEIDSVASVACML